MPRTIAIAGKGGVGKTTLAALTVQSLVARGAGPVLAVDADSNANLHELLGVTFHASVGGVRESARREAASLKGVSKQEFLDLRVQQALVEENGFDLLVMGRPEGQGCYCFANNVLRDVLERLAGNYRHVILDSEAGLEHISRRTLFSLDLLMLVSDASVRGVRTAARISALADEVALPARSRGLVINRVPGGNLPEAVRAEAAVTGLPLLKIIPYDESVAAMDGGGSAVNAVPAGAPARAAAESLIQEFLTHAE